MQWNSFRRFRNKNYNSIFARKWKKTEEAICDSSFSKTGLCSGSNLSLCDIYQVIRASLPESAYDLLHLLILANVDFFPFRTGVRYSGEFIVACHRTHRAYRNKEIRRIQKENELMGGLTGEPIVRKFLEKIGKFPFCKVPNPVSTDEPIESYFAVQYDDLLNAIIDDALIRYLSRYPKLSLPSDNVDYILDKITSNECLEAVQKIIPSQQTSKKESAAKNRIISVALTLCLPDLYRSNISDESRSFWNNSAWLPSILLYLLHYPQEVPLKWKDISACVHPSETQLKKFLEKIQEDPATLKKSKKITDLMLRKIISWLPGEEKYSLLDALQCSLLPIFEGRAYERSDLQIDFLNYFNAPYTARRQVSGGLASNYIGCDIPVADYLDIQVEIVKKQFETITRLAQSKINEDGEVEEDYSDAGKLLNRSNFLKKTRVPIFLNKVSFFSQCGERIYNRIIEHHSNFVNLWELFCLLQPTTDDKNVSPAIEFNRSVALEAFNALSGAVDLIFHTGIPKSSCCRGFGTYDGAVTLTPYLIDNNTQDVIANDSESMTLVGYPFELWCSGLKTKFTMLKYGILASERDVKCINNIIDWVYNCLCNFHISTEQLKSFDPYKDIYEFIDSFVKDRTTNTSDDVKYKPLRPSIDDKGIPIEDYEKS